MSSSALLAIRYCADACPTHCPSKRPPRSSNRFPPWLSSRYPPRPRSIWPVGAGRAGPRTISLAGLVMLLRPFDLNATPGPYVPGDNFEALAFTVSVITTPFESVAPAVELAVSQDGVLMG